MWRNWYTRTTQNRVRKLMWVRLPPSAPAVASSVRCIDEGTAVLRSLGEEGRKMS